MYLSPVIKVTEFNWQYGLFGEQSLLQNFTTCSEMVNTIDLKWLITLVSTSMSKLFLITRLYHNRANERKYHLRAEYVRRADTDHRFVSILHCDDNLRISNGQNSTTSMWGWRVESFGCYFETPDSPQSVQNRRNTSSRGYSRSLHVDRNLTAHFVTFHRNIDVLIHSPSWSHSVLRTNHSTLLPYTDGAHLYLSVKFMMTVMD